MVNHLAWSEEGQCLAVVSSSSAPSTLLLQRFNSRPAGTKKEVAVMYKNPPGGPYRSSGFFTKGGNAKGRRRFREKIGPLAQELQAVEGEILDLLAARRLLPGADITVLVRAVWPGAASVLRAVCGNGDVMSFPSLPFL